MCVVLRPMWAVTKASQAEYVMCVVFLPMWPIETASQAVHAMCVVSIPMWDFQVLGSPRASRLTPSGPSRSHHNSVRHEGLFASPCGSSQQLRSFTRLVRCFGSNESTLSRRCHPHVGASLVRRLCLHEGHSDKTIEPCAPLSSQCGLFANLLAGTPCASFYIDLFFDVSCVRKVFGSCTQPERGRGEMARMPGLRW